MIDYKQYVSKLIAWIFFSKYLLICLILEISMSIFGG